MMLARVADSLYWIGRYVERAEHMSRVSDIMLTATLDQNESAAGVTRLALASLGRSGAADLPAPEAVSALLFDRDNAGAIASALAGARENARQVRDQITTEMWERLNLLFLRVSDPEAPAAFNQHSSSYLHGVIADLHLFSGATNATMSHGEGWRFLLLGVHLERAHLIARLLDAAFASGRSSLLEDHLTQMAVLRMACALEPYLRVYTAEMDPGHLLQFLLFDRQFPRSIRFATLRMEEHLTALARGGEPAVANAPERLAGRLSARLEFADLDDPEQAGPLLSAVVGECSRIHHAIYETFVAYPLELRLPA